MATTATPIAATAACSTDSNKDVDTKKNNNKGASVETKTIIEPQLKMGM